MSKIKNWLSPREKKTLAKMCGSDFVVSTEPLCSDTFWAEKHVDPRTRKNTYGATYYLGARIVCAYYHKYTEHRDGQGNLIKSNEGPFYWGKVFTQSQYRRRYGKSTQGHEHDKHFVSGKTWQEFKTKMAWALAQPYK